MRVISMQSPEVWEIIQRDKVYYADLSKCREHSGYKEDREELGGKVPIWCFWYPEFSFYTMYNNELLEELRCEMSLGQDNCWDNFVLLELEVPKELLHKGQWHNGSSKVKVFDHVDYDMVQAVYTVHDSATDKDMGWYFKVLTPIFTRNSNVITTKVLDCEYWDSVEDTYTDCFIESAPDKCLHCGKETKYTWLGKHYCCLAHMWKHKSQVVQHAMFKGEDIDRVLAEYNAMPTSHFKEE